LGFLFTMPRPEGPPIEIKRTETFLRKEEKPRRRGFPRARRIKFIGRVGKYAIDKPAQWLHERAPKGENYLHSRWKRVFDFASVVPIAIAGAPIISAEAAYIALRDKANPFYALPCVGKDGKTYGRWKIRTMVQGARHWPGYEVPMIIKSDKDPRVTHPRLRKGSIDEFPQVWNVLKGEMSVVGPIGRPPEEIGYIEEVPGWRPEYKKLVRRYLKNYLQTRPGITGLAQIMGRGNLTLFENAMLETYYLKNASWVLDLSIALGTPFAVISGIGAY
jgi:lipopolysaccharide/colanic/teichoic acid biosynthesis glycosyltransferase